MKQHLTISLPLRTKFTKPTRPHSSYWDNWRMLRLKSRPLRTTSSNWSKELLFTSQLRMMLLIRNWLSSLTTTPIDKSSRSCSSERARVSINSVPRELQSESTRIRLTVRYSIMYKYIYIISPCWWWLSFNWWVLGSVHPSWARQDGKKRPTQEVQWKDCHAKDSCWKRSQRELTH